MAYDSPETSKDRDILGRWLVAINVFELIHNAPVDWSLRIGIYGRWGEGKTTALKFIETLAKKNGFKTVWFNPWAAQDRNQLWNSFGGALKESFEQRWSTRAKQWVSSWLPNKESANAVSGVHPLGKIVPVIIEKLSNQLALKKSDIEPLLATLGEKKLVVFIDDLDRSKPDLVPYLLLSIRELLDVPQCAFVLALDPHVVAKALPIAHPGWGTTTDFMEKIIDFPFWLPRLEKEHLLSLAKTQLSIGAHRIPESVISDLSDLLPPNPRQLKLFFRKMWRLTSVMDRHEEKELDWKLILILELARNVSTKAAEMLLNNSEFLELLFSSEWLGKIEEEEKGERLGEDKWVSILKETAK